MIKPYFECEHGVLYKGDFLNNTLPDKSQQLIIADPPYFQVKGDFDFIWGSFEDYLKDVEKWAKECKRLLADNGTLFWYGPSGKIAYSQVIFDKYFNLVNNLVWNKGSFMGLEKSKELRSFAPCTERILMYENSDMTGLQYIEKEYIAPKNPFALELRKARFEKNVSINQVAEYGHFYGNVNHGGSVTNWERGYNIPSKEQWEILCRNLPIKRKEYEELRKEYEELRKEYEELRRPFDNFLELQEVFKFSNEQNTTGSKYNHPTVKPEKLTEMLIKTCSRKGANVLIPFAGSGTEVCMSVNAGTKFTGFEIEEKYCDIIVKRIEEHTKQLTLF